MNAKPTLHDEVIQAIARGWCHGINAQKEMDADLALAIAAEVEAIPKVAASAQLAKALTRLCRIFPTDGDMAEAGWAASEIKAACDAYDAARAALAKVEGEQSHE